MTSCFLLSVIFYFYNSSDCGCYTRLILGHTSFSSTSSCASSSPFSSSPFSILLLVLLLGTYHTLPTLSILTHFLQSAAVQAVEVALVLATFSLMCHGRQLFCLFFHLESPRRFFLDIRAMFPPHLLLVSCQFLSSDPSSSNSLSPSPSHFFLFP